MNFLKRIELWVLLLALMGGILWVFNSAPAEDEGEMQGTASLENANESPLKLHRAVLERDYGNVRLDLDLRIRNDKAEKLVLQAPEVRLLSNGGREVSTFFLPFDPVPEVAAKSTQDVQLRYWLEASDLKGALTLEVDGLLLEVKSSSPLDINSLKNGEKKAVTGLNW
jgi:hypothetical protein